MRITLLVAVVLGIAGAGAWSAPLDLKGQTLKATFEQLLPGLDKQDAQQKWQIICFQLGAPGNEAQRLEACKLMAARLDPSTPVLVRVWLLKQLERIGREECIEAVARLLRDKEDQVRDGAIRCLANNPAPGATGPLWEAFLVSTGKPQAALANALARRANPPATEAIVRTLKAHGEADQPTGDQLAVAIATARLLGKIGNPEAERALAEARSKAKGELHLAVCDAYLQCANRRVREGKTAAAAAIYKELNRPDEPRPIRLAALLGVIRTAGDQAGKMCLEILAGPDAAARAIAIGQIENLNASALKPLADNLGRLPVASRVLVLNALAARGDRSQLPVALAAARSPDDAIRRAGILALGRLGDASVVGLLLETLYAGGNLAGPAGDSLAQLGDPEVNAKLIAALEAEPKSERITTLIGILQRRQAKPAVPALLKAARSDNGAVRNSAFAGLRDLAEPRHLPEMALALLRTSRGKEREQAEQALVAVAGQVPEPEKRAEPVLGLLQEQARDHQADLLPLLGRLGGPRVRQVVQQALASSNPELHDAAVTALCNWPEPSVSPELLQLAQSAPQAKDQLRALQAVIPINTTQPVDRPQEQRLASLAVLKKAMMLASRDQERKAILEGIGFVRHLETLHYVLPYLDDKDLNQSACRAVVELAHSRTLREPNKAEFNKALDRVIGLCKNKGLVDRARQYREGQ